jgi:phosphoglycerate dehydrogenase-like enzyme
MESTFSKMKKSAVFMNIGRGTTVNEDDLVKALNEKMIRGAVIDVFKNEPLAQDRAIWNCQNVLITPHCAD